MSYRTPSSPTEYRTQVHADAESCDIYMDNCTKFRMTIQCYYEYTALHSRQLHDYVGWPSPDYPDNSCQSRYRDGKVIVEPIDLTEEGYDTVDVRFSTSNPSELSASGTINGNVIEVTFDINSNDAVNEDAEFNFYVYVTGDEMKSLATKGTLHVLAGKPL